MKYPSVTFEFVGANGASSKTRGVVIVRETEMVLEVEWPLEDRPYLIRGKTSEGYIYAGSHEGFEGDTFVHATWTRLDDICEGTWVEDGEDYRFTFRLTPASQPKVRRTGKPGRPKGK